MSRISLVASLVVLVAVPLHAQRGREHFVQPDTAIDAEHAVQRDAFLVLRDSTSTIRAASARLMSDLTPSSSRAWIRTRAQAMAAACARSEGPLEAARAVTESGNWPMDRQRKSQVALLKEMTAFAEELRSCQVIWAALSTDTSRTALREQAPYQMKLLEDRLRKFDLASRLYLQYIGIKLAPSRA